MIKIAVTLALIILVVTTLAGCGSGSPQAQFSAKPAIGYAPLDVQFNDQSTGKIDAWEWDFDNDGIIDSTSQNAHFVYNDLGNYTVSLKVIGPDGSDTETKTGYVEVLPCPRFANFTAEPTVGEGITTIQFTDLSTGNVTGWAWDFQSDGIVDSTEQNPGYIYSEDGLYSVTLTLTTPTCPDIITKWDYINISGCHT